jgi:general secretion pathway protein M
MSLASMNPAQRRQLAVGLVFAVIALVIAAIAIPVWLVNRHYSSTLESDLAMLDRYKRIVAIRPAVTRDLELVRSHDPRKFFLRSGATALSAAEVQEALRTLVDSGGGRLITMQAPNSRVDGRYRQVSVNVQLTANVIALRKILGAIEARQPMLFVENIMVRSQVPGNFKPGPGAEPEMFVSFDIVGYSLEGAT